MHRHCEHDERRGRTVMTVASSRTPRSRAWPHGRNSPVQSGQRSSPPARSGSTSSGSVPTISNGCLSMHQATALPSGQGMGRAAASSTTSSRSPRQRRRATHRAALKIIATIDDAGTPTRRQPAWRSTMGTQSIRHDRARSAAYRVVLRSKKLANVARLVCARRYEPDSGRVLIGGKRARVARSFGVPVHPSHVVLRLRAVVPDQAHRIEQIAQRVFDVGGRHRPGSAARQGAPSTYLGHTHSVRAPFISVTAHRQIRAHNAARADDAAPRQERMMPLRGKSG